MNKIFLALMVILVIGFASIVHMVFTHTTSESSFQRSGTAYTKDGVTVEVTVAGNMNGLNFELCKFVAISGARGAFSRIFYKDIPSANLHKLMVEELSKIDDGPCNIKLTNVDVTYVES